MILKNKYFTFFILLLTLLVCSCSKRIVHPKNFEYGGIKLLPNNTFHNVYTEFDVGGALVNLGTYNYKNDNVLHMSLNLRPFT